MRIYTAGLLAFLLGVPLTERAFAQGWDILNSSLGLAGAISNAAGS
jgi:hypothetical protein